MLHYNGTDISDINVNKTSASKECIIFRCFVFQTKELSFSHLSAMDFMISQLCLFDIESIAF